MASRKNQKINESPSVTSNNYMNVGDSGTNLKPAKVSLIDVFNQHAKMKADVQGAPGVLPYPLTGTVIDELGEVYIGLDSVEKKVKMASASNFIKDNPKTLKKVTETLKAIEATKKHLRFIGSTLDDLT